MPDITMCTGAKCALKETCFRFKANASSTHQSYFVTPPVKIKKKVATCKHYWKLEVKETLVEENK